MLWVDNVLFFIEGEVILERIQLILFLLQAGQPYTTCPRETLAEHSQPRVQEMVSDDKASQEETDDRFELQVAGHGSLLKSPHGNLLKPFNDTEFEFYSRLQNYQKLAVFAPRFYGSMVMGSVGSDIPRFIEIENLTKGYRVPCVMDIKVGRRHYGPDASQAKIERNMLKSKTSTSWSHGIRVCGMKTFNWKRDEESVVTREEGRKLSGDGLRQVLETFAFDKEIRQQYIRQVRDLCEALRALGDKIALYSSSLLLVHEGAPLDSRSSSPSPSSLHSSRTSEDNLFHLDGLPFSSTRSPPSVSFDLSGSSESRLGCSWLDSASDVGSEHISGFSSPPSSLIGSRSNSISPCRTPRVCYCEGASSLSCKTQSPTTHTTSLRGKESNKKARVRMIDFAHSYFERCGMEDGGYLFGLENLLSLLEAIKDD